MKIIKNNIIPFQGFAAINLFGVLFVRKEYANRYEGTDKFDRMIVHESIHTKQQKEMLYVFFYIWYVIEWLIRLFGCFDFNMAYRNISFEQEAYSNEGNINYVKNRPCYMWLGYF